MKNRLKEQLIKSNFFLPEKTNMSLVAYGNSDSDASDSEDEQNDIEPVDNSRKGNAMPSGEKQFENNPTTVPKRSLLSGECAAG